MASRYEYVYVFISWYAMGNVITYCMNYYTIGGRNLEAIECFDIALTYTDPTDIQSLYEFNVYRGITLEHIGKIHEALAAFDTALQVATTDAQKALIAQYKGSALAILLRFDDAVSQYMKAVELNRYDAVTYGGLTSSLLNTECAKELKASLLLREQVVDDIKPEDHTIGMFQANTPGERKTCEGLIRQLIVNITIIVEESLPNQMDDQVLNGDLHGSVVQASQDQDETSTDHSSSNNNLDYDLSHSRMPRDDTLYNNYDDFLNIDSISGRGIRSSGSSAENLRHVLFEKKTNTLEHASQYHYSIFQLADALNERDTGLLLYCVL